MLRLASRLGTFKALCVCCFSDHLNLLNLLSRLPGKVLPGWLKLVGRIVLNRRYGAIDWILSLSLSSEPMESGRWPEFTKNRRRERIWKIKK